ncbi:hypothetical protein BFP70_07775 [Thioclava sp. SK-1]|uniref:hypothetical protein n=1 Tax=Thioclava sp. SK-1 TaxID=1889770 RepID=UPI0008248A70|nr:hypothetical protein [Thioclava sp. SK-1]OCX66012.1 hypothetical protein BFP70_07775 [Thioclava sp. SK-1]
MNSRWLMIDEGCGVLTHARGWPLRWDLAVESAFPLANPRRLARGVRQDMWRRLQNLRGFRPMVRVAAGEGGLVIRAGGEVDGRFPRAKLEQDLADLLADPGLRSRWLTWAALK